MSAILRLAIPHGQRMASVWRNPAHLAATAPPWLPGLLLTLTLTAPAWLPFLHPNLSLPQLHDGTIHLVRAYSLQQHITSGDWYPRWFAEHYASYGYPALNFYAPATYYLTVLLAWLLPIVGTYGGLQLVGALAALAMLSGVYTLGWQLWRHGPAALSATAIVAYAPYPLAINLFLRGALPEVVGAALLVWLLVGCTGLWLATVAGRQFTAWWLFTGAITIALLLTHNISSILGACIAPAWVACLWLWQPNRSAFLALGGTALGAAVLTAFFWLPALLEMPLVQLDRIHSEAVNYRNWFLTWPGYHASFWGSQETSPQTRGFPVDLHLLYPYPLRDRFQGPPLGSLWQGVLFLGTLVAFALAAMPLGLRRAARLSRPSPIRRALRLTSLTIGFGLLLALICYAQLFDWAVPLWEHLPPLRAVQFPFRLLTFVAYGLALAAGGTLTLWTAPRRRAWVAISLATIGLAIAGIGARTIPLNPELSRTVGLAPGGLYTVTGEFVPKAAHWTTWHEDEARGFWLYEHMFPEAAWLGGRVTVWHGTLAIRHLSGGSLWTRADVTVEGDAPAVLAFHQLAFAGWRAWVDDQPVPATPAPWIETQAIQPGFLLVTVPPGDHRVAIRFGPKHPPPGRRYHLLARLPRPRRLGTHHGATQYRTAPTTRAPRRQPRHYAGRHRGQRAALDPPVATANGSPPAAHHRDHRDRRPPRRPSDSPLANRRCLGPRPLPGRPLSHGTRPGSPLAGRGATGAPLAESASPRGRHHCAHAPRECLLADRHGARSGDVGGTLG